MNAGMTPTSAAAAASPASPAAPPVIELKGLTKKYGDTTAVNHLNLTISRGEIFGLLGPNGAGKTTTILMMLGLTEPTSGRAKICGLNPAREALKVKRKVGYLPDDIGFYEDRTALDNLIYTARLNGISRADAIVKATALLEKTGLSEHAGKKVGTFSRGMRQRLGLADVLIKNPEVIILDEPTLGIDPEGVRELLALISALSRDEQLTVLLSSHHLHQVQQICDRVGLFVQGKLIAAGDIRSLSEQLDEDGNYYVEVGVKEWLEPLDEAISALEGVSEIRKPTAGEQLGGGRLEGRRSEGGRLEGRRLDGERPAGDGKRRGGEQPLGGEQPAGDGNEQGPIVTIVCDRDLTAQIAEAVIHSGAELFYIRRKEYGLDDIYHRYFERREES